MREIDIFIENFINILGHEVWTQVIKEQVKGEGVLYSVIVRPFYGSATKWFGGKEGYVSTPEFKKITRRVSSAFKKSAKMRSRVKLDPEGFLLKPSSKRFKGKSYYPMGSAYLHMVFVSTQT
jgi:hypothetical protein